MVDMGNCRHSGTPPDIWKPSDSVPQRSSSDIERTYRGILTHYGNSNQARLIRHFDYELDHLRERKGNTPESARWTQGRAETGYHPFWHTISDEVCLSAYLRTLAWTASKEILPEDLILQAAAYASPIDLGLWGVQPTKKPTWWPQLTDDYEVDDIDTQVATVIAQVESATRAWGNGANVILAASGCISQTDLRQYDLDIRSCFQRTDGPLRPTSEELFQYLNSVSASVNQDNSPLRFEGVVDTREESQWMYDWLVIPTSGSSQPVALIGWQTWRGARKIECPSNQLIDGEIRAVCRDSSIEYQSDDGLVARWSDWSQGISAQVVQSTMSANGWVLTAPREIVERFANQNGLQLAWAWEITSYLREYPFQKFTEYRVHDDFGANSVIRPW